MAYMTPSCWTVPAITEEQPKHKISLREQFMLWIDNVRRVDMVLATR